ncbi:uncharacterized protein LOC126336126 [Schistocerca gregaria]|uniref:uncharacterized protein LOC126336126 n=1 Tax=Schistocerca gregaria TaxID=7010 RepID=UPI00211EDA3B|nr:uncharacterized protein LOC126336126 [Schistocerca gregaria]
MGDTTYSISITWIYRIWQFHGIAPSSYNQQDCRCFDKKLLQKFTKYLTISSIWIIIAVFMTISDFYVASQHLYLSAPRVTIYTDMLLKLMTHIRCFSMSFHCSFSKLSHFSSFLAAIHHADKLLDPNIVHMQRNAGNFIFVVDIIIAVISGASSLSTFSKRFGRFTTLQMAITVYAIFCDFSITMQFVESVLELWIRLKCLNASLVKTLSCLGEPNLSQLLLGWQQKEQHVDLSGRLRLLQRAHLVLQRAAEFLETHVSPAMTFHVVYSVLGTIYSSYEVLIALVVPEQVESILVTPSLSFSACWLVRHVFELVALTLSCSALQDQEAQATTLLRRAAGLTGEEPEVKAFLSQLERGPTLRFTASGLLPIDRRLLVSAISATVTYLVLLGQLGLTSSSRC